jgi:Protein of unknown function (DUF1559)
MHNYHDTHHRFPPAAVCGKDGKPLLSWRVLLLPFIEQDDLYKQFHLDEPWDSPHNIQLVSRMPLTYGPYKGKPSADGMTYFRVFVGPGAAFEADKRLTFADFKDGTSNTFMIVEAWDPVPWTKPEELTYDPNGPLPPLGGIMKDGTFRVGLADGSVHNMPKGVRENTIRAYLTRNGGEVIDDPALRDY